MKSPRSENVSSSENIISPFSESEVTISEKKGTAGKFFWILGLALFLIFGGVVVGVVAMRYLNNPYRTLENFPVEKYLDGYQALAGSKFKAEFRVEADLGWKEGAGRLMLFSTVDDPRPIAVLIPAAVGKDIYFTKGQTYLTEIEVKEGRRIYADSCEKN